MTIQRGDFERFFHFSPDLLCLVDRGGSFRKVNDAFRSTLGYSEEELPARPFDALVHPEELEATRTELGKLTSALSSVHFENRFCCKDGSYRWLSWTCRVPEPGSWLVYAAARDITDRKAAEALLLRMNRALESAAACSRALIRSSDEKTLLDRICRVIVETGGYRFAWVGCAREDEGKTVIPVAQAGFEQGYLESLDLTWADKARGRGPTGTAIRTGRAVICRDIQSDPHFAPWREDALRQGYASSSALPLAGDGPVFGALNIYAVQPDAFDSREAELLQNLADNLAYGITTLRIRAERQRSEKALEESRREWEITLNAISDWVTLVDPASRRILRSNCVARSFVGLSPEALTGRVCCELLHGRKGPINDCPVTRMIESKKRETREVRSPDGDHWYLITADPVLDEAGKVVGAVHTVRDITDRKESELEIRTIHRVLAAITGVLSLPEILETVLDESRNITGLEGGTICMVTPENTLQLAAHRAASEATIQDLSTNQVAIGDCLCGKCAQDHKPLILSDRKAVLPFSTREAARDEEIRFHAAFPLISGGNCLGVLCLFTRTEKKPTERSLKLIETVTAQIALAIRNAQLHEETLHNAATLEEQVRERTAALERQNEELARFNKLFVDREFRIKALRDRVKELKRMKR